MLKDIIRGQVEETVSYELIFDDGAEPRAVEDRFEDRCTRDEGEEDDEDHDEQDDPSIGIIRRVE